jgi:hypothetical protein
MAAYSGEIRTYAACVYANKGDQRTALVMRTDDQEYLVFFYRDGAQLPNNYTEVVGARRYFYIHTYFDTYSSLLDLLRNEKPVFAHYRDDLSRAEFNTNREAVGEGEPPQT